jgi:hypothetical protein
MRPIRPMGACATEISIPIPTAMSPITMAPVGMAVIGITVRSPVISRSIVAGAVPVTRIVARPIVDWSGNAYGNENSRLRFAYREKATSKNYSEHKKQFSHNCISVTNIDGAKHRLFTPVAAFP